MEQLLDEHVLGKTELRYAGFWERFFAAFIDGIIVGIPSFLLGMVMAGMPVLSNILGIAAGIAYYVFFESGEKQGTIGKQALGLRVVDAETHGRITPKAAFGRYLGRFLSTITLLIGYFMMLFNDKKQTLHDKLAGTYVVK